MLKFFKLHESWEEFKLLSSLSLGITFLWKVEFINVGNYLVV